MYIHKGLYWGYVSYVGLKRDIGKANGSYYFGFRV